MGSCNVPPIRVKNSGTITGIIEECRIVLSQKLSRPVAYVPESNKVVIGGDEQPTIWREVEGVDETTVFFEGIPYEFRAHFPDLKEKMGGCEEEKV